MNDGSHLLVTGEAKIGRTAVWGQTWSGRGQGSEGEGQREAVARSHLNK
jgi:hypothetical protein